MNTTTSVSSHPASSRQPRSDEELFGSAGNFILTIKIPRRARMLGTVTTIIGESGADIHWLPVVASDKNHTTRDITITLPDAKLPALVDRLKATDGVVVEQVSNRVFRAHEGGKLEITPRVEIRTAADLSKVYTPGVADVCTAIHQDPDKAYTLTIKGTTILVVSDGSRVLALGDIGPKAAMPVMEGKAMLFKRFAGVNAVPICLDTKDTEEIIRTVRLVSPGYGGVNLEDIASPRCYEIERRLQEELDIPVFHDDQHGTAIVVTAAALNAARLVRKQLRRLKVVCCGTGAAGLASAKLLMAAGVRNLIGFNGRGAVHSKRTDLTDEERWLAANSNRRNFTGTLQQALDGADLFVGLSVPGAIKAEWLKSMKRDAIVFALANPVPEVLPEDAAPYARVIATGGSNYPNQINNALAFPGIFRGLLDNRVRKLTEEMKLEAARALAAVVKRDELDDDYIIPSVFDSRVAPAVAGAITRVMSAARLPRS